MRKFKRHHYKVKRKKSIFKNRLFGESFLLFLEISFIFYFLIFSQTFRIEKVYVFGDKEIKTENLQEFLQEKIEKFSPSISIANIFLVNSKKLEEEILKKFPEIDVVEIKKNFPNILDIEIKERRPVAIFCFTRPSFVEQNLGGQDKNCGFLDKKGIIFEKNDSFNENLPLIKSQNREEKIILGEDILERETLEKILKINESLETKLNIEPKEYVLFEKSILESRLNVKTSQGWEIFFDLNKDIDLQILKLKLLLEEEIPPENRKTLEYIDLRFTRVYYK